MKKYLILLLFISLSANAEKRAVTEEGDIVLLNENGTWIYEKDKKKRENEIPTNPSRFIKPGKSNFAVKSTINNTQYWINPKKWSFEKSAEGEDAEFVFKLKDQQIHGHAVNEKKGIGLDKMADLALTNLKNNFPEAKVITKEYRRVNRVKVIFMELTVKLEATDFTVLGYYYSGKKGSTQLVVFTPSAIHALHKRDIKNFLNGFALQ